MKNITIKKISISQLISLITLLVLFGGFILISSGMFDSYEGSSHQHTNIDVNNRKSSVDLNVVNEINKLEGIVKNNPKNHEAVVNLAHLLNDNGFYERAVVKYEQYLKVHPSNADVIVDMGVCYFELKEYERSISIIKNALEINPKHQIANFNLGIVNLANNNKLEAIAWWKKARDIDPNTNIGKKAEELLKTTN